ncbi:MAG: DUF4388 domain-containing protein [Candidatus Zixiibacteriota bacterium]
MMKGERLDAILLRRGWVTEKQILQGLRQQQRTGIRWGSALVQLGIINETRLAEALAEQYDTPIWDPATAVPDDDALALFRENWARAKAMIPLSYDPEGKSLRVAMVDPLDVVTADEIRFHANIRTLTIVAAPQVSLQRMWDRFYRRGGYEASGLPVSSRPTGLSLEFGFTANKTDAPLDTTAPTDAVAHVLLWLSQPFVAKLLRSLLEVERCVVSNWDGRSIPEGDWDHLVYDEDNALCNPDSLTRLKRALPRLQLIARPSWTTCLLRSPLSYERLRDGYLRLAAWARRWSGPGKNQDDGAASRCAVAMARVLRMQPYETDTLVATCELAPLLAARATTANEQAILAEQLGCPYPIVEVIQAAERRFDETGLAPGQSAPDAPFPARVYAVIRSFLAAGAQHPVKTIEAAGALAESLRQESGKTYDPLAVEALLRVVREEVLEGYLPPGPAEVMLVSDHPVEWQHLVLLLENEGWRVVVSHGAAEARTLTERRKPDAVVWAASGAIDWIRWQSHVAPGIANFLLMEEFDSSRARTALEAGYEDVWSGAWDAGVASAKLRRAVQKRPQVQHKSEAVTGTLGQLSFIDMVQILAAGSRSVKIELHHGRTQATVILWQGQIKFAETTDRSGESAVYDILSWPDATFSFSPVETMPQVNCHLPNEAMLLEGCRLIDEGKRESQAATPART